MSMKVFVSWPLFSRSRIIQRNRAIYGVAMKPFFHVGIVCIIMLLVIYKITRCQYQIANMEKLWNPFDAIKNSHDAKIEIKYLPRGIIEATSDLELRPLWFTRSSFSKEDVTSCRNLLAIPTGVKQKNNVNVIVQKFLLENFTVILFHYDGNMDEWHDFPWAMKAIHVVAHNQTKWWFAKRFLHPDVVSIYDYLFIWDEDLGVEHFNPARYLEIVKFEGLEISQPALDPELSEIHHRITIRKKSNKVHRRIYDSRGSMKCSDRSVGPPCSGWVEGMAPVFSRSAWRCAWHLIQNDLIHGWGLDMKLGYCAQGDGMRNVGVVDSEYIIHQGIQTLGGKSLKRGEGKASVDVRSEIRRQSTSELEIFRQRWNQATREDTKWTDRFQRIRSYTEVQ